MKTNARLQGARAIAAAVAMVLLTACATDKTAGEIVDDATITTRVKSAYATNKTVDASDIKIDTYKGVVQLSGFADSPQEISEAVRIARSTPGVKSVRNDITTKPAQ